MSTVDDWNRPKAILERAEDDVDRVAPLELRDALRQALLERNEACEELEVLRGLIEGEPWAGAVLRRDFVHLQERVEAAGEIISANGCDCECDHVAESHDEDCERCLACRISSALWPSVSK